MSDRPDELAEASFPALVADVDDHAGHRQRVRERFLKVGGDALEDYELLELALQLVIPRRDTKALAKTLLREFGSFSAVFNASEARLAQIKGLGDTTIARCATATSSISTSRWWSMAGMAIRAACIRWAKSPARPSG